jgi:hypothetical protein
VGDAEGEGGLRLRSGLRLRLGLRGHSALRNRCCWAGDRKLSHTISDSKVRRAEELRMEECWRCAM